MEKHIGRPERRRVRRLFRACGIVVAAAALAAAGAVAGASPAWAACGDGSFNAQVTQSGTTYIARNGSREVYSGSNFAEAVRRALGSLSSGRTSKQSVVIRASGTVGRGERISIPSYTIIDSCGTITVSGSDGSGDQAPMYARSARDIEIRSLKLRGNPLYGIFMRSVSNLTLGEIDLRLSGGLGIRIDNHANRDERSRNIRIDNVYVERTGTHGVETYGVDGLTIGTVTARDTGHSGLLLNDTINATVGTVDARGTGTGTGYAAFRIANRAGRVGSSYPTNIRVGTVNVRGGGRGIFCVSESGGATFERVDIRDTGNNAILLENCSNVTVATASGVVGGSPEIRISGRDDMMAPSTITLKNLTVSNTHIRWSPCRGSNIVIQNVTRRDANLFWC